MKNTLAIGTIILFIMFGIMFWGRNSQETKVSQNENEASVLSVSEKLYDFGTISMKNGLVDHVFKLTNSSGKDILLKKVVTSCMCTSAYITGVNGEKGPFKMEGMGGINPPANETIKVGESLNVRVVYDPNAHGPAGVGVIDRFVYLTDVSGKTLQLEIKAQVTP